MTLHADDRPGPLTVIAYMRAAPGKREQLRAELESLIEPTRLEKGCITFDLHQGDQDPDVFFLYEKWETEAHLDAHFTTPHLRAGAAVIPELTDDSGTTITRLRQIA